MTMTTDTAPNVMHDTGLTSYQMSLAINRAQRAFNSLMKTCLGHHGLTIPEWSLLGKLYQSQYQSQSGQSIRPVEAAETLGVKPPFIAKLIMTLLEKELIVCELFPDDERGKILCLTPKGATLVQDVESKLEHCLNGQLGDIARTDLRTFFTLNEHIAKNVRHH